MAESKISLRSPGHPFAQLKAVDPATGLVNAIIESPKGCQNKYKLNEQHGFFELHKVLPYGMFFPLDFGFVAGTRADDGDPLDILVFMDEPTFTGCVAKVRIIGAITAEQRSKALPQWTRNDRMLAVSVVSHRHQKFHSIDDVDANLISELEQFFISYNKVQGKEFKVLSREGLRSATQLLEQAITNQEKREHGN